MYSPLGRSRRRHYPRRAWITLHLADRPPQHRLPHMRKMRSRQPQVARARLPQRADVALALVGAHPQREEPRMSSKEDDVGRQLFRPPEVSA